MKPCPECGNKDYTYYQEMNEKYFLICTNCGYHAEGECVRQLEDYEESIENLETNTNQKVKAHDRPGDSVP